MSRADLNKVNKYADELTELYEVVEREVFNQIVKRLKVKGDESFNEWYVERMKQSNLLNKELYKDLERLTGVSSKKIDKAIREVANDSKMDIDSTLKNVRDVNYPMSELDVIIKSYREQVFVNINNYVNQSLVSYTYGTGAISEMYQTILNEVSLLQLTGNLTMSQAIEKAVIQARDKGLPSHFIDKGGRRWNIQNYVHNVFRSTLNRTYNEVRTERMKQFDITTVKMTELPDPAKRCANCQGRVLDMRPVAENDSSFPSIYEFGYGEASGTLGSNCRHAVIPFVDGVNIDRERQYKDDTLNAERYQDRMRQRELERRIRRTKNNIEIAKGLGNDVASYNQTLRRQRKDIREFLKEKDWLRRSYDRERNV